MKIHQRQGFTYCWAPVLLLFVVVHEMVVGQPQVYFKNPLPAKSLPRIGRRSDIDPFQGNMEPWNDMYSFNYNSRPESVLLWKKVLADSNNNNNNMYTDDSQSQLSLGPSLYKLKEK